MRDTAMFSIIDKEAKRQQQNVELIASENFVSQRNKRSTGKCTDQQIRRRISRKKILWGM